MSESEYAAVDFELVQLYRNNTIRVVTVILAFSLIVLVIDVVLFVQTSGTEGAKNIAHTLSITAVQTHLLRIPLTSYWCFLSGMHSTCTKRRSSRSSDTCNTWIMKHPYWICAGASCNHCPIHYKGRHQNTGRRDCRRGMFSCNCSARAVEGLQELSVQQNE